MLFVSLQSRGGEAKNAVTVFQPNNTAFLSKKVCYKVYCAKTVSGNDARHPLACLPVHK